MTAEPKPTSTEVAKVDPDPAAVVGVLGMPEVTAIRAGILASYARMIELADDGDLDRLLVGLAVCDIIANDLRDLRSEVGARAHRLMDRRRVSIEHVGTFERQATLKRATDWDAILTEIRGRALVDEHGEVVDDPVAAVDRCLELVRKIVPLYESTGAKQGGLKDAGVNLDSVQRQVDKTPNVTWKR